LIEETTLPLKAREEDWNSGSSPLGLEVVKDTPLGGMRRFCEYDHSNSNKELVPSMDYGNSTFELQIVLVEPFLGKHIEVKKKKGKKKQDQGLLSSLVFNMLSLFLKFNFIIN
jgi:hypothetical protein